MIYFDGTATVKQLVDLVGNVRLFVVSNKNKTIKTFVKERFLDEYH